MIILVILCYRTFLSSTRSYLSPCSYRFLSPFSLQFAVLLSVLLAIVAAFFLSFFLVSSLSTPSTHWQSQLPRYLVSITAAFVEPVSAVEEPCRAASLSYDNFAIYVDTSPATVSVLLWRCSCILDSTTANFILGKLPTYLLRRFQSILNGGGLAILHWFRLPERVNFTNAQDISKVHDMTLPYLNQLVPIGSVRRSASASTHLVESSDTITRILFAAFLSCAWSCPTIIIHLNLSHVWGAPQS